MLETHWTVKKFSSTHRRLPRSLASYLFHLFALPFAAGASDLDRDGALLATPAQGHPVGLQRAEGDLQLGPGEAAGSAVLQGDLRGLQHRRTSGALLEAQGAHWSLLSQRGDCSEKGLELWRRGGGQLLTFKLCKPDW